MNRIFSSLAVAAVSMSVAVCQPAVQTFTGEISDSQCAMNVHSRTGSHQEMLAEHTMGNNEAECVRTCVRFGGVYVLISGKQVYRLSDQKSPDKYAAQKVRVRGSLNKKSNTIIVQSIEPVS